MTSSAVRAQENWFMARVLTRVTTCPDLPFVTLIGDKREDCLSWGDLGRLANRFAFLLRSRGVNPGDTVLLFLPHGSDLYGAFVGALLCGAIPSIMPLLSARQDPDLFWTSHATLLSRLRPAAVVAPGSTLAQMRDAGLALPDRGTIEPGELGPAGMTDPVLRPESEVAVLQHSSGTTGLKKGVALSFTAIVNQLDGYGAALALDTDDWIASWLPLYHDMGFVACLLLPLYRGLKVRHIDPFHWVSRPATLLEALHARPGGLAWMPNFGFEHLARTVRNPGDYDLSGVKMLISCSEPCKPATFDRFQRAMAPAGLRAEQLGCCYALAENTFAATQTATGRAPARIAVDSQRLGMNERPIVMEGGVEMLEVGSDIGGVRSVVVNAGRQPVEDGTVGEIAISGGCLFTGYNLDPDRTSERLVDRTFYTGDLGFRHEGRLFVLGRIDDLIIVNGRNLFAHEIEAALTDIPGVKPGRAVAVASPNPQTGSADLVVIAERAGPGDDDATRRSIMAVINSIFAVMPKEVSLCDAGRLIKTTSGKISRSANLQRYLENKGKPQ